MLGQAAARKLDAESDQGDRNQAIPQVVERLPELGDQLDTEQTQKEGGDDGVYNRHLEKTQSDAAGALSPALDEIDAQAEGDKVLGHEHDGHDTDGHAAGKGQFGQGNAVVAAVEKGGAQTQDQPLIAERPAPEGQVGDSEQENCVDQSDQENIPHLAQVDVGFEDLDENQGGQEQMEAEPGESLQIQVETAVGGKADAEEEEDGKDDGGENLQDGGRYHRQLNR